MTIGNRIKTLRSEKKLNQKAFSEVIEISTSYLSDIESGKKSNLNMDIAVNIAKKLPEISLHWLLTGEGEMYAGATTNVAFLNKKTGKPISLNELNDSLEMVRIELDRAREEIRHAKEIVGF